jgi:hypothetical protein
MTLNVWAALYNVSIMSLSRMAKLRRVVERYAFVHPKEMSWLEMLSVYLFTLLMIQARTNEIIFI